MMSAEQRKQLSKYLSLVLRHKPQRLGLHLDDEGTVHLAELLAAVRRKSGWEQVTEEQIREVVASSDRVPAERVMRFEISGDRIRARYGHSVPQAVTYPEVRPPELLFHGTSPSALPSIRTEGLQPMRRQFVHLSIQTHPARLVGQRHAPDPIVLAVQAREAWEAGVKFHQPEDRLYLSTAIPPEFIAIMEEIHPDGDR